MRIAQKLLKFVLIIEIYTHFFHQSYPEDALEINVKHVGFSKSDVRNE